MVVSLFVALLSAIASVAILLTQNSILKGQKHIMATDAQLQTAVDALTANVATLSTNITTMETNVDALLAKIADPNQPSVTASDTVVAELTGLSSTLGTASDSLAQFHAPIAVVTPTPTA